MESTVTVKDGKKSQKEIVVTIPAKVWEADIDVAVSHFGAQVKVSGFRKGKVPKDVVMREVGKEAIIAEAAERAIKKAYAKAVIEHKIQAIAQPMISITKLAEGNDLSFTATVAVLPEITLKEGWKKAITKANDTNAKKADVEISDEEVNEAIAKLAQQRAENVPANRPAKMKDVAIIDFSVSVDGATIEGGVGKDHPLVLGSNAFIPGFEEAVVGMVAGEEKTVTLSFPKTYHAKHLAGKDAEFTITLKRVEEQVVPEIDDAFAQKVHPQSKTVADLKAQMKKSMQEEKKNALRQEGREALAEVLAEYVEGELPDQLIDSEIERMEEQFSQQLAQSGTTIEEMLKRLGKTKEELHKDWRPQALKRAKIGLALDFIAQEEHVEPEKEKVEEEMQKMVSMYGGEDAAKEKNVDLTQLYNYTKAMLQQEAVFDFLEKIEA